MKHKFWTTTSLSFILLNAMASPIAYADTTDTTAPTTEQSKTPTSTTQASSSTPSTSTPASTPDESVPSTSESSSTTPLQTATKADLATPVADEVNNMQSNAITATISAPATYQTYTDPVSHIAPSDLSVSLAVSISQSGIDGATVEVPYAGFMPTEDTQNFQYFTMTDPLFSYIEETGAIPANSIVDHYENDSVNKKLIIHLKQTTQTVETLQLKFKYNTAYDAKVPADQVIWNNLQATIKDSTGKTLGQSNTTSVKSSAVDGLSAIPSQPAGSNYTDSAILTTRWWNQYNKYSILDETKDNRFYIEVPEGTDISSIDILNNITPVTSAQDSSVAAGYVRYYKSFADNSSSFSYWNYAGDVNSNFLLKSNLAIQFPTSLPAGSVSNVKIGMIYTKINGETKDTNKTVSYTKADLKDWDLNSAKVNYHGTGSSVLSEVNSSEPTSVAALPVSFGGVYTTYDATWGPKNQGRLSITGVSETLIQPQTGSEKLNFNAIDIKMIAKDASTAKNYYRMKYTIKDVSGTSRVAYSQTKTFTGLTQGITMDLPTLATGEYIDQATAQPMGENGIQEGVLLPGNAFYISYQAKNWSDLKWPDGTPIPQERTVPVKMSGSYSYNNEQGAPITNPIISYVTYYVPSNTTEASAQFVSGNATSVKPGDTVNYEIQGYNGNRAIGAWQIPVVTVAIPKQLEMVTPGEMKDYVDKVGSASQSSAVKVELLSSDATYNYYRFTADGKNAQKNATNVSFSIPLTFKVASGTPVGSYPVPYLAVGTETGSFPQLVQATNNLSAAQAATVGYDNSVVSSYTGITSGHTPLTVASGTKLDGSSAGRGDDNQAWSNTNVFAVEHGAMPQMKASILNSGNTSFTNARLYDILPQDGDSLGSSGNMDFSSLDNTSGGTVYYTTKAVSELPTYDSVDLQSWTAATLVQYGFTTTKPASGVTAIYVDFGTKVIAPNEALDTILTFEVPASGNQKAINQFRYSAKEVGTGTTLNASSTPVTFTTENVKANFVENLPSVLPSGVTHASDIPGVVATLLDAAGNGSLTIPSDVPTLSGYTFKEWVNSSDSSDVKHPGDSFTVTSAVSSYIYKAVWVANSVNVNYHPNDGSASPTVQTRAYDFGSTVSLTGVTTPTRTGYGFQSWNTSSDGTGTAFNGSSVVDFTTDKTVYAQWKANSYSVSFDNNSGTGSMTDQAMTYDVAQNLTANDFAKTGYSFQGWNTEADGSGTGYTDTQSVKNLTAASGGKVTLYAQWKLDQTSIDAHDSTLYVGDTWNKADNFTLATDENGLAINFSDVTVTEIDTVDTTTPGQYKVTYTYKGKAKTITVNVVKNQETLVTKDMTIFEDDPWTAAGHFISATTKDGTAVNFDDLTLEGISSVDPSKAGTYTFKATNGETTNVVKLTVLKDQSSITVFDSTITVGDSWTASDNFDSATDRYGNPLKLSDLTVTGVVDTNKAGKYTVTYSWAIKNADGSLTGETLSIDAYITVVDKATPPHSDLSTSTKVTPTATRTMRTTNSSGTQASYRSLPKTGEESSFSALALGTSLLLLGGALALFGVKRRKKN